MDIEPRPTFDCNQDYTFLLVNNNIPVYQLCEQQLIIHKRNLHNEWNAVYKLLYQPDVEI